MKNDAVVTTIDVSLNLDQFVRIDPRAVIHCIAVVFVFFNWQPLDTDNNALPPFPLPRPFRFPDAVSTRQPCHFCRRSIISLALAAPAMFFWGIGTSTIAEDTLSWTSTSTATALAVATIIIPGIDAFTHSKSLERWYDQVR